LSVYSTWHGSNPLISPAKVATTNVKPFTGAVQMPEPSSAEYERWNERGIAEIALGRVAVLVLAGGQVRTRLIGEICRNLYALGYQARNR